jgi:alpha/beta superfamily hydrolase
VTSVHLTTSDGHVLEGDLALPDGPVVGAVVVCHPHPQYGGDRFNPVVASVYEALPPAGFAALRFDFRRDFGGGAAERLDVVAALDELEHRTPSVPLWLAGYSFGAVVALDTGDDRVRGIAAIAPPLSVMAVGDPVVPTLVLSPAHDQFCPPHAAAPIVGGWPDTTLEPVASADHFLAGHAARVAERVVAWLTTRS